MLYMYLCFVRKTIVPVMYDITNDEIYQNLYLLYRYDPNISKKLP